MAPRLQLFALAATTDLGRAVADALGVPLAAHEERGFEDGEHKVRPLDDVAGNDVYVVQSTHGDQNESANDKLVRLAFFIGAAFIGRDSPDAASCRNGDGSCGPRSHPVQAPSQRFGRRHREGTSRI